MIHLQPARILRTRALRSAGLLAGVAIAWVVAVPTIPQTQTGGGTATAAATTTTSAPTPAKPKGFVGLKLTVEQENGPPVVHNTFEGSPAARAGLREGDVLQQVDDVAVKDLQAALDALARKAPGDTTVLRVDRFGKEMTFTLTVAPRPEAAQLEPQKPDAQGGFDPAVTVRTEDYTGARARFRTRLMKKGPSPQEAPSVAAPPPDVRETFYQSGKLRLKAWVSRPDDTGGKHPAVLFLHGGFAFGFPDDWEVSKPYRDGGFVVMTPMLRGENGQPGAFSFLYDEVDDALAAAEALSRLPYVDANRIFIAGPSAGGTVALLAAMASTRFRAVASFSATPDQVVFCRHAKHAARDVPVDITDQRELEMRSPLAYAASLKCPARLYVGTDEPEFHATTRMTAKVARDHGRDAEAILVEGDHGSSVMPAVKQSVEFFLKR